MFKVEESLLNRFDLIFVMTEPKHDKPYMKHIMNMIIDEVTEETCEEDLESDNWPRERITAHIAFAKTYNSVKFSNEVDQILFRYFKFCSMHKQIPKWRTTSRMYEGLRRITLSHARLVLRTETKIFDAITTIMLTEMSYPLGFLMEKHTLQLQDEFMGPNDDYVTEVLQKLKLPSEFMQKYREEQLDTTNILDQIIEMRKKLDQTKVEEETEKCNQKPTIEIFKQNGSNEDKEGTNKANNLKLPLKNQLKSNLKKTKATSIMKSSILTKRKVHSTEIADKVEVKKAKIEEPILFNDAIVTNLASLSKQFSTSSDTNGVYTEGKCEITSTIPGDGPQLNGFDEQSRIIQAELKALEDLNMFEDFD